MTDFLIPPNHRPKRLDSKRSSMRASKTTSSNASTQTCNSTDSDDSSSPVGRSALPFCSFSRSWLNHVAYETLEISKVGRYRTHHGDVIDIRQAISHAKNHSVHYHEQDELVVHADAANKNCYQHTQMYVVYTTSLQAAQCMRQLPGDIGILNSASARTPGGKFVSGTLSQEDGICRASLLFPCLEQFAFREHHYYQVNRTYPEGLSSKCAIFAPRVPIVRKDSMQAPLLDEPQINCSFVSLPAPNAFTMTAAAATGDNDKEEPQNTQSEPAYSCAKLRANLYDRLFRAMAILHQHQCRHLVLCAFGCGMHGNDPTMVADIFLELLQGPFAKQFETVVFAIQPSRTYNHQAFTQVFPKAATEFPEEWQE